MREPPAHPPGEAEGNSEHLCPAGICGGLADYFGISASDRICSCCGHEHGTGTRADPFSESRAIRPEQRIPAYYYPIDNAKCCYRSLSLRKFGSARPPRLRRANIRLARRQPVMQRFVSGTTPSRPLF